MGSVTKERAKAVRDGMVGFAATVAILAPATWGAASATADDPSVRSPSPPAVVGQFAPARPASEVMPAAAGFGEATLQASVRVADDGRREMVIEIHNPGRVAADVKCDVSLREVEFPESEPWARILPPPIVKRVVATRSVAETVPAGETRTLLVRLPEAAADDDGARPSEMISIDVP